MSFSFPLSLSETCSFLPWRASCQRLGVPPPRGGRCSCLYFLSLSHVLGVLMFLCSPAFSGWRCWYRKLDPHSRIKEMFGGKKNSTNTRLADHPRHLRRLKRACLVWLENNPKSFPSYDWIFISRAVLGFSRVTSNNKKKILKRKKK